MSTQKEAIVKSPTGLHARPGSNLVELAMEFESDITLETNGKSINAKEIMDVLSGDINAGDNVTVIASGTDEVIAAEKIAEYINTVED